MDAAQKYVSGFCTELKNTKTGKSEEHCVNGVVTWTPGDVTVAESKGGLVSIVSTREYRSQMPNVIIGNKRWMAANRAIVTGMLGAIFDGGERIKQSDDALRQAAALSALVYKEKDAGYWYKYFRVQTEKLEELPDGNLKLIICASWPRPSDAGPAAQPRRSGSPRSWRRRGSP